MEYKQIHNTLIGVGRNMYGQVLVELYTKVKSGWKFVSKQVTTYKTTTEALCVETNKRVDWQSYYEGCEV